MKIGKNRLIPKETMFWSIKNQCNLMSDKDEIVEITHNCIGNDIVFVKPKQLIFNMVGHIPTLIERGSDEWSLSYSNTLSYVIPNAEF